VLLALCCAAGGLLGLWQGMLAAPLGSSPHLGDALLEVLKPVAIGVAVGVAAGGLAATVVCAMVPWLRDEQALTGEHRVVGRPREAIRTAVVDPDLPELGDGAVAVPD
jgi:hypothetical protein